MFSAHFSFCYPYNVNVSMLDIVTKISKTGLIF